MDRKFTISTAAYVLVLLGCTFAFYVQRHVVYHDHIEPGQAAAGAPVPVLITGKGKSTGSEASLTFLNKGPLTTPLRMGSEMQEQLQAVLIANLATAAYLILMHARRKVS